MYNTYIKTCIYTQFSQLVTNLRSRDRRAQRLLRTWHPVVGAHNLRVQDSGVRVPL